MAQRAILQGLQGGVRRGQHGQRQMRQGACTTRSPLPPAGDTHTFRHIHSTVPLTFAGDELGVYTPSGPTQGHASYVYTDRIPTTHAAASPVRGRARTHGGIRGAADGPAHPRITSDHSCTPRAELYFRRFDARWCPPRVLELRARRHKPRPPRPAVSAARANR
jgi:hypothetical protein